MTAHLQSNDWLVFLDGVQVPWQSIQYDCVADQPARGTVFLEPDAALARMRPYAVVALFCRDRYGGTTFSSPEDEILRGYTYFGGGEVVSLTEQRQPHGRSVLVSFESDLALLDRHRGFASGVGNAFQHPWVAGTTLINPYDLIGEGLPNDLLSLALVAKSFDRPYGPQLPGAPETYVGRSGGSADDDFGQRLYRLLGWLGAHNGSARMQCVRSRLMNKIAAIDDRSLTQLLAANLAAPLLTDGFARLSSSDSLLTIVRKAQSYAFYRFVTVPAPHFPATQPPAGAPYIMPPPDAMQEAQRDSHRWRLTWLRNDYLFLPDLYYSAPPPCNLIFPDMLGSRQISRRFDAEPTRSVAVDATLAEGAQLVFVHAPGLSDEADRAQDPAQLHAVMTQLIGRSAAEIKDYPQSPWASPRQGNDDAGASVNTLTFVSDDELERGIVIRQHALDDEYALARARTMNLRDDRGRFDADAVSQLRADVAETTPTNDDQRYIRYAREWLQYKHRLARFDRPSQIELRGNRWIVPGFSAAIFDADGSYLTYVTAVRHAIDASGQESTFVSIDRTRPLTTPPPPLARTARATATNVVELNRRAGAGLAASFAADTARYRAAWDRLSRATPELAAARAAWEADEDETARRAIVAEITETAAAFRADYALLIGRAQTFAEVAVGPSRNEAGALTTRLRPDVATELLTFLRPPRTAPTSEPPDAATEAATAQRALSAISGFNEQQEAQARAGLSAHGEAADVVAAINASGRLLADAHDELLRLSARWETELDLPLPPDYYNEDFVRLSALDRRYRDLLGCEPFYTGPYGANLPAEYGENQALAALEYQRMLTVFGRAYPAARRSALGDTGQEDAFAGAAASWDDVRASGQSTMEWQHRTFLRRKAQTLAEYLTTHGFEAELELLISDEPTPTVFRRMKPRTPPYAVAPLVYAGTSFPWDDSAVSRLVDEGRDGTQDPLVAARRQTARSPALTAAYRQELIVAYSRQRFGSRAHDGT